MGHSILFFLGGGTPGISHVFHLYLADDEVALEDLWMLWKKKKKKKQKHHDRYRCHDGLSRGPDLVWLRPPSQGLEPAGRHHQGLRQALVPEVAGEAVPALG